MCKMEGSIMQSLTRNVERRLIETPLLPALAVFLAGMLALIITFALLALLAACGWDCLSSLSLGMSSGALAVGFRSATLEVFEPASSRLRKRIRKALV
jgi:hypothetical protein